MSDSKNLVFSTKLCVFFAITGAQRDKNDAELLRELEAVLQPQTPFQHRARALRELCESDRINRLEDVCIPVTGTPC